MRRYIAVALMLIFVVSLCSCRPEDNPVEFNKKLYLHDDANVLSSEEQELVTNYLISKSEATKMDIVVATTNSLGKKTMQEYTENLFSKYNYGQNESSDGIVLLINTSMPVGFVDGISIYEREITTFGEVSNIIPEEDIDDFVDDFSHFFAVGDSYNAFIAYADCCYEAQLSEYFYENLVSPYPYFNGYFIDYFTPDEYMKLDNLAADMSAELEYAISKNAFVVHQTIATYNSSEEKYLIINETGNVIADYGDNSWVAQSYDAVKMGEYTFVKTNGKPSMYDIVDSLGNIVTTFDECSEVNYYASILDAQTNLGQGYWLFTNKLWDSSTYYFYLLSPSGEYFELQNLANWYYDVSLPYSTLDTDLKVGQMSEDLFSMVYGDYYNSCAVYFNSKGERIIDLSTVHTNYNVYLLGEFKNGQAEIEFRGADNKMYVATINTAGDFVGEPQTK